MVEETVTTTTNTVVHKIRSSCQHILTTDEVRRRLLHNLTPPTKTNTFDMMVL